MHLRIHTHTHTDTAENERKTQRPWLRDQQQQQHDRFINL